MTSLCTISVITTTSDHHCHHHNTVRKSSPWLVQSSVKLQPSPHPITTATAVTTLLPHNTLLQLQPSPPQPTIAHSPPLSAPLLPPPTAAWDRMSECVGSVAAVGLKLGNLANHCRAERGVGSSCVAPLGYAPLVPTSSSSTTTPTLSGYITSVLSYRGWWGRVVGEAVGGTHSATADDSADSSGCHIHKYRYSGHFPLNCWLFMSGVCRFGQQAAEISLLRGVQNE